MLSDLKFQTYLGLDAAVFSMLNNRQLILVSICAEIAVLATFLPFEITRWRSAAVLAFCSSATVYHFFLWFEGGNRLCPCLRLEAFGLRLSPIIANWLVFAGILAGLLYSLLLNCSSTLTVRPNAE